MAEVSIPALNSIQSAIAPSTILCGINGARTFQPVQTRYAYFLTSTPYSVADIAANRKQTTLRGRQSHAVLDGMAGTSSSAAGLGGFFESPDATVDEFFPALLAGLEQATTVKSAKRTPMPLHRPDIHRQ